MHYPLTLQNPVLSYLCSRLLTCHCQPPRIFLVSVPPQISGQYVVMTMVICIQHHDLKAKQLQVSRISHLIYCQLAIIFVHVKKVYFSILISQVVRNSRRNPQPTAQQGVTKQKSRTLLRITPVLIYRLIPHCSFLTICNKLTPQFSQLLSCPSLLAAYSSTFKVTETHQCVIQFKVLGCIVFLES